MQIKLLKNSPQDSGEGPLQIEFTNIAAKKTATSFVKLDRKGVAGEKGESVTTSS
jgi:hypothetical protein